MHVSLAAILHRLDPYAIGPYGWFGIRWYGLAYVAGFVAGYLLIRAAARRRLSPLEPSRVGDLVAAVVLGTILGGRLGYCVFYRPDLLIDFSGSFPFWGALAINEGGMASHGGMIGIVLSSLWFARAHGVPALHLLDLMAMVAPIGVFFGRLANFVNGELMGRECSADLPWAVKFPQEITIWDPAQRATPEFQAVARHVEALDLPPASGGCAAQEGELGSILEAVRSDDTTARALEPLLTPRHPSQIYQALLEGVLLFVVLAWIWRAPRKPGIVGGWFLIVYASVRILAEQFREPDPHIGFQWLHLTRGQWLSSIMFAAGIVCLTLWSRRQVKPLGGWRSRRSPPARNPG